MSNVNVTEKHSLSKDEARKRVAGFEDMLSKYGVKAKWSGDKASVKGVGVSGDIAVNDSDVNVNLKLGMMAKAAGIKSDKLESSIRKRLRAAFDE